MKGKPTWDPPLLFDIGVLNKQYFIAEKRQRRKGSQLQNPTTESSFDFGFLSGHALEKFLIATH